MTDLARDRDGRVVGVVLQNSGGATRTEQARLVGRRRRARLGGGRPGGRADHRGVPPDRRRLYHPPAAALFEAGVLAMMLWDDVGGRTWIERAGPRTATVQEDDNRPRRRERLRRTNRSRHTQRSGIAPERRAPEAPR